MLTSVHIRNILSCDDVRLDNLTHVVALIGRNGAGKTNVMRAIDWMARSAMSSSPVEALDDQRTFDMKAAHRSVRVQFKADGAEYQYYLALHTVPLESRLASAKTFDLSPTLEEQLAYRNGDHWSQIFDRNGEVLKLTDGQELQIPATTPSLVALVSLLPPDSSVLQKIVRAIHFLSSIHYYPFDELNDGAFNTSRIGLVQHDPYVQWLSQYKKNSGPTASVVMRLIYMSQECVEDFNELKELMGPNGLGLLSDIEVRVVKFPLFKGSTPAKDKNEAEDQFYFVRFVPANSTESCPYSGISFGTKRVLRMLLSLIFDKSSVILIEQPEDGIHLGLLHKLIALIETYSDLGQVFIASHAPTVFNRLEPSQIRLVDMHDGKTTVRALSHDETEGAVRYISEDGPLWEYLSTVQEG